MGMAPYANPLWYGNRYTSGEMTDETRCKIYCVSCRKYLYFFVGTFDGDFDPACFRSATPDVPPPQAGKEMRCPRCTRPWYLVRERSQGLILFTSQGWKPRAPEGDAHIYTPADYGMITSEVPEEFRDGNADFKEPTYGSPE